MVPAMMLYLGLVYFISPDIPAPAIIKNTVQKNKEPAPTAIQEEIVYSNLQIITSSGTVSVKIETASTPEQKTIGLMYRKFLEKNSGMLFVFDKEEPKTFWMKNTLIPIDIIFISSGKKIVSFETMEPCAADPCVIYSSGRPAQYALEVNKGFVKENEITTGNQLIF